MWKHESGYWYADVRYKKKRLSFSLKTKDKRKAIVNYNLWKDDKLNQLIHSSKPTERQDLSIKEVYKLFLAAKKEGWTDKTYRNYESFLRRYCEVYNCNIPKHLTTQSRYTWRNHINSAYKWGYDNKYMKKHITLTVGKRTFRSRVYSDREMIIMLEEIKDEKFRNFVKLAYFTGARRGELSSINSENCFQVEQDWYVHVKGKSGIRLVKINRQAMKLLNDAGNSFNYNENYITKHFKKNMRRIGIKDARFHDLRRTFGLNLIRKGMPIYQVSKLLGHSSVKITESHYAPLLVSDIPDFTL
tara:strand:- start:10620 stop:11522 length:903 start_codon:yes stop_codon:yes gene_type:complete